MTEPTPTNLHDHAKCKACYQTEAALAAAQAQIAALTNIGLRLAGCLWDYKDTCPECGNDKANHMPGCKQTYAREFKDYTDSEKAFRAAFPEDFKEPSNG